MIRNYCVLCLFGILTSFVANAVASEAIIGGDEAKVHQFPYQVSVRIIGHRHICGGGIIDRQFVVTAAHCVVSDNGSFYDMPISILAGTNDMHARDNESVSIDVQKVYVPKEFRPPPVQSTGDIAVLKLKESLELSHFWSKHKNLYRLKVPKNYEETYADETAKIAGYGWNWIQILENNTERGNNSNGLLHYADVGVLTHKQCQELYYDIKVSEKLLCARVKQRDVLKTQGVCSGDSGSPLVHDGKTVIGILSLHTEKCEELTNPAIYTRITHYFDFIRQAMKDKKSEHIRTRELTR